MKLRFGFVSRTISLSAALAAALVAGSGLIQLVAAAEPVAAARVAPLLERLKDPDFEQRRRAADALGDLGPAAAAAVPALVAALADEHVEVHWYALDALGRIGNAPAVAVPALARADQPAHQSL